MARGLSSNFKAEANAVTSKVPFFTLAHLYHQPTGTDVYINNSNQDVVSNGNTYIACGFNFTLPNQDSNSTPRASISIDNIGKPILRYIYQTNGGFGTIVTVHIVLKTSPDVYEHTVIADLSSVNIDAKQVSFQITEGEYLQRKSVPFTYREFLAPGLF